MKKLATLLSLLALAAFGFSACGSDDEESTSEPAATTESTTGGDGGTVSIEADPDGALAFTTSSVTAPAGDVSIEFDNPASIDHDVVVEDGDGNELARTDVISAGTTSTSADLEPGDYTFYCSVDAHREAGMEGALTVE